jgi:hypothetical protein
MWLLARKYTEKKLRGRQRRFFNALFILNVFFETFNFLKIQRKMLHVDLHTLHAHEVV